MMPSVTTQPREHKAPPPREREVKRLDERSSTSGPDEIHASGESVEATDAKSEDGTRSVQDLIAAAMKMFAEPKPEPAPVEAPQIQLASPTIEAAVHQVLDQITAKPETDIESLESSESPESHEPSATGDEKGDMQLPEGMINVRPELQTDAPMTAKGPVATTAVRDPAPLPENPNPSHVNLVLDDGPERVVVTVAVRGNEVHAMVRGGDEQTAAAIARNAASLDHALRAGGLDLASFSSERDLDHHAPREQEEREQHDTTKFEEDLT